MKSIFSLCAMLAIFAAAAFADVRLPDTPKPTPVKTVKPASPVDATLHIEFSPREKTARLVIPRSQLKELRAELEGLDDAPVSAGFSRAQTVVGGLFLSLAFVFGGVWFARAGKNASKKHKIAAAGALLFFSGAFATIAFGNIGPPSRAAITSRIFNAQSFNHPLGLQGPVKLEIGDDSDNIRLIVPEIKEESK
jgi:hypothetical protein